MKKILYIATLAAAALSMISCEKINSGLTRTDPDSLSPETYFSTEAECQLWLNPCYTNYLTSPTSACQWCSDAAISNDVNSWMNNTRLVTSANTGETMWGWSTMRRINMFLENSDKCTDEAVRLKYEGEARFFRALGYFTKVKHFGDVPWYDHVVSSSDSTDLRRPRDPRGYIMLQVMKDLDFAIENLSETPSLARVTKWTALALKSRAALFEGTWRVYHSNDAFAPKNDPVEFDGQPVSLSATYFLQLAADAAEQIMKSGIYTIYSSGKEPYRTFFGREEAVGDEVILAKFHTRATSELKNFGHSLPYSFQNYSISVPRRIINMYLCKDGSRFTDKPGNERMWFTDEMKDRDPRLSQTFICQGFKYTDEDFCTINNFYKTYTGYKASKWSATRDQSESGKGICDLSLFRYAEVLLNYAEAKAELGQLGDTELDKSVNLIRARVGMPALKADVSIDPYMASCYPNYTLSKGSKALVLEVRRERIIELMFEGFQRYDVLRWKEGAQQNNNHYPLCGTGHSGYYGVYVPGVGLYDMDGDGVNDFEIYETSKTSGPEISAANAVKLSTLNLVDPDDPDSINPSKGYMTGYKDDPSFASWDENRDYLYPIPLPQITLTAGALTQNPGWN